MFTCKASLSFDDAKGQFFSTKSILIAAVLIVTDCPFTVSVLVLLYALTTSTTSPAVSDLGGGVCSTICIWLLKMTLFDESTNPEGAAPATAGTASTEIASAKVPSSIVMVLFIVLESSPFLQARHMV